jgi:hypothetical protein
MLACVFYFFFKCTEEIKILDRQGKFKNLKSLRMRKNARFYIYDDFIDDHLTNLITANL